MTLGEQIRKGSLWLMAGGVSSRIIQFAFGIVLARLLLPSDFGLLVTVSVFTGIAGFFAGGGMGAALVRVKQVSKESFSTVFTVQLVICTVLYFFFFSTSGYLASSLNEPIYEQLIKLSALNFLLRPFINVPKAALQRDMRFKEIAYINFFTMLFSSSVSVILAYRNYEVWSLIIGGLSGSLFSIVLLYYRTRWFPVIYFNKNIAKDLGGFGVKIAINDILSYLKSQITNLLISIYYGPNIVGLFNKGNSLCGLPRETIAGSIYQTLFRALSSVCDDLDKTKYIFYRTITLQTVYLTPFYVLIWWLSYSFIVTVYGSNWVDSSSILQILSVTGALMLGSPSGAVIEAQNRVGKEIFIDLEVFALLVAGILIGFNWGISGAVWAIVIVRIYNSIRLYCFASSLIQGSIKNLIMSLAPGYTLNLMLIIFIYLIDYLYFSTLEETSPDLYLLVVGGLSGLFYFSLFLFIPIKVLSEEQKRWKGMISKCSFNMSVFGRIKT